MSAPRVSEREPYDTEDARSFTRLAIQAACEAGASAAIIDHLMDALRGLEDLPFPSGDRPNDATPST